MNKRLIKLFSNIVLNYFTNLNMYVLYNKYFIRRSVDYILYGTCVYYVHIILHVFSIKK